MVKTRLPNTRKVALEDLKSIILRMAVVSMRLPSESAVTLTALMRRITARVD